MVTTTVSANILKLDFWSHGKYIFICTVAMLSSFQYGLDYALVGGFLSTPGFLEVFGYYDPHLKRWNIDHVVQQLISSIMTVATFVSPLLVGPFSSRFGRKPGPWAAILLIYAAAAIQIGTTSKEVLYFARFLMGFSIGWLITFAPLYAHETAPANLRGIALASYQILLSMGGIVGYAVDYGTRTMLSRRAYKIPLAIFFVVPTIQAILLFFVAPESPRWLVVMNREREAEAALRRLRNHKISELELQTELNEIRQSTREQIQHSKNALPSCINIYTVYFLEFSGVDNPLAYRILVAAVGLIGVLLSLLFVRRSGCHTLTPFTFELTHFVPSAYAWLLGGEYANNQLRAFTFGPAAAINFLGNWAGTFSAPYFINPASFDWGPKYGYIWFGSNMVCAMLTWLFLPETKDRTLEEIHEMIEARLPARKFEGYVCVGVETAAAQALGTQLGERKNIEETTHAEEVENSTPKKRTWNIRD
ncbi:uncharacterized protein Z520_12327 [Fonsecaea multimorphosa CBS 102226]|uniref:Major facilitator superfamily (MFS) profile domain-containing protein n=1 Tax=Fonsecaea multimorphosa CBS 102226 TaxID=1442371 RepID=A0A0D2K6E3_9EURO|nr:uncharacterized protein Z520_12327 [Fonsecaea multimorphosa CBS 102226]KIX91938.1 hypothetical protein Z520_12327 [Fonsecaea multimorphosa CBS 102226]